MKVTRLLSALCYTVLLGTVVVFFIGTSALTVIISGFFFFCMVNTTLYHIHHFYTVGYNTEFNYL